MEPITVLFILTLTMPDQEPTRVVFPMTLAECLYEANEFLTHPGHTITLKGGTITAACRRALPPSLEH